MKKTLLFVLFFLSIYNLNAQELRATWIARDQLASRESLAKAMDSLARNNFNVVYVLCWSRGYPMWQSELFQKETGVSIDPVYAGRDILAEAVAEGHRVGLNVEAWFEYGFVGGWTGNNPPGGKGPIFAAHPDWVSKRQDGTEIDNSNFYWMVHTRKDVQDFLIGMVAEVCRKYDIDGVELDRIRYSSLEYGYDDYTVNLYKQENNNAAPPTNVNDSKWLRWRADKLNQFIARAYDSIKNINSHINVSNAPSLYSSSAYTAYNSFAQDWAWWVNNNKIDNIQLQMYVATASSFSSIMNYMFTLVDDSTKVFPSLAIIANQNPIADSELVKMVNVTRSKGLKGNSIWYYTDLVPKFGLFKSKVYQDKTHPPFTTKDWREYRDVAALNTPSVIKNGSWTSSTLIGFSSASIFAEPKEENYLDYNMNVPIAGNYDVYIFNIVGSNRSDSATYYVYDSSGVPQKHLINQKNNTARRWVKLGNYYLTPGNKTVIRLSTENTSSGEVVSGDAAMIILNRQYSPNVSDVRDEKKNPLIKDGSFNLRNYPNPFNSQTRIKFSLTEREPVDLKVFDIIGKEVMKYKINETHEGENEFMVDFKDLVSGVYFVNLIQNNKIQTIKVLLTK